MPLPQLSAADWSAVSTLLDEALALPAAERDTFVDALAGERAQYRDTLRQLLAGADGVETAEFLATLPHLTRLAAHDPLLDRAGPQAGDAVGPYRLLREIGSGGMGAVWLAERADGALKRTVALKLPRMSWDPAIARRVARERDILASLEHPRIARLYDAGLDAQGRPYLAMEYVDGQPIDAYCRTQALPLAARVGLLLQVAQAVAYAHRRLVVHRDLKPSNILVTVDGEVRLLDFGIARLLDADGAGADGTVAGPALTPAYASPEQLLGEPLSTATDVYSLGVVAHELLVGARPFDHLAERGARRAQAIAGADPPLPSSLLAKAPPAAAAERGLTAAAWRRQVAGDLDAVLLRALARRPEDRYPSIEALADDLARWRDGRPVTARRATRGYLLARFVQRHRVAVAAGAAASVALVATAVVAVASALHAREQEQRAQAARDFMIGLFERADPDLRGGRDATARELLEAGEADAARLPPAQRHEVMQTVATLWMHFNDMPRAAAAQARLSAELEAKGGEALAHSRLNEARFAMLTGKLDDSDRFLAAAKATGAIEGGPPALRTQAAEQSGWLLLYRGKGAEAVVQFQEARALAVTAGDLDRRVSALYGLTHAQQLVGTRRAALQTLYTLKDLTSTEKLSTRAKQDLLIALSSGFYALGRYAEGWPFAVQATEYFDALYGNDSVPLLRARVQWMRYALQLGREREAAEWLAAYPIDMERARTNVGPSEMVEFLTLLARVRASTADAEGSRAALALARTVSNELDPREREIQITLISVAEARVALALSDPTRAASSLRDVAAALPSGQPGLAAAVQMTQAVADARRGDWRDVAVRLDRARYEFDRGDLPSPNAALAAVGAELAALHDLTTYRSSTATADALVRAAITLTDSLGADHPHARTARALANVARAHAHRPLPEFQSQLLEAAGPLAHQLLI